ncbi:unnamed protein product [Lymnaea stagnalis]|uniref:Cytochrome P450 n=1 Tax=Lymnaea stagnalis TaxID=6523 RepID=A0AAV2IQY1_LYMST
MASTRELLKRSVHRLTSVHRLQVRTSSTAGSVATDQVEARPFEEIPGPRGMYRLPIIGSMLLFKPFSKYTAETYPQLLNELFDRHGPIMKLNLASPMVVVSDPKDFETVFANEGKYPYRPSDPITEQYLKRSTRKLPMTGVHGEEWHALRTPVNRRLMKADSATHYLEPQNQVADDFVKILETRDLKNEDQADLFYRFASESIGVVTFNQRLGYLDNKSDVASIKFLEAAKSLFLQIAKGVTGRSVGHNWYRNSTLREYERAVDIMIGNSKVHTKKAIEITEQQRRDGTLNPEEPNLLLSLASEKALTDDDVSNTIIALYVAGTDSTAKNLQVFFYNLAKNPDKQETLRKEVLGLIGPSGPLTDKALSQMTYLKACLKESFRLNYPTLSGTTRVLPVDVVLSGYKVPSGTMINMFNPRPSKLNFDEPDKYLPERWLRSSEKRKQDPSNNMAVLPFGHGPRNCIGRRFAVQEIYLATSKVLQKLKIELEPESWNTQFQYSSFLIEPEKPLKFKFTRL